MEIKNGQASNSKLSEMIRQDQMECLKMKKKKKKPNVKIKAHWQIRYS